MTRLSVVLGVLISAGAAGQDLAKGEACTADDPRIGFEAVLQTRQHGVSGVATIIDDCTIMIEDFNYDGGGVDVRVYGFENADLDGGVTLSEDLIRDTPYVDETLIVNLPDGITLDDVAVISIWCVPVGVSFGDGAFAEPGTMMPDGMDTGCPAAAGDAGRGGRRLDPVWAIAVALLLTMRRRRVQP